MKKLKKHLALFLTLSMLTSMLQLPAFAAISPTTSGEVMNGSYVLDTDGTIDTDAEGTTNGVVTGTGHGTVKEGEFTLTKSARKTGENAFDITLTVQTSHTITKSYDNSATVLVLDMSNSMNYNFGDQTTRLNEAEKVAKEFLASYAGTDAAAEQWLSIVWFGTGSGVDQEWINVAGGEGEDGYDAVYEYFDDLDDAPHGSDSGGTNLEAGLKTVQDQLAKRSDIAENKNVVVITDGKPTYRIGNKNGVAGSGNSGSKENNDAAAARAEDIQETATIYTVCIAAEDEICYSGSTQYICSNCQKSRDEHEEVDLCRNCGEHFDEHEKHQGIFGGTYYTCPGKDYQFYRAETYYYCDENRDKQYQGTSVTTGVTVGDFLKNDIASDPDNAFNAATADELEEALAAIAGKIEESGNNGKDTTVTDPMGQFIVLGEVTGLSGMGVTASDGTITWELDPATLDKEDIVVNGDTTTYTYSITYPITLNTAANGFEEDVFYPTNGYTYLSVPQEEGDPVQIPFNVPGVKGEIPKAAWKIEHYLQDEDSINKDAPTYTLKNEDNGQAKLWSKVYSNDYVREYAGYRFVGGNTELTIKADATQNVIQLYYNLITAPVTVKHYYKVTTITPEGNTIGGDYVEAAAKTSTKFAKVGSQFEATLEPEFGGDMYTFDSATPDQSIKVSETGPNLIELRYSIVDDQCKRTSAQVDHVYIDYTYELNEDGKYVLDDGTETKVEKVQYSENLPSVSVYTVKEDTKTGYTGYTLNTNRGDYQSLKQEDGTLKFALSEDPNANIRTLYFEKIEDNRKAATVTVEHYYTKNITEIVGGSVNNYNDPDGEVETESFNVYVGERFKAVQENVYEGETYNSDETNADKLLIEEVKGGEVIKLYYDLSVAPKQAEVIANHYWRTFTEVTVELTKEVVNEETGEIEIVVIGTDTEIKETVDKAIEGIKYTGLYEGQKHVEAQQSWGEGYTFNKDSVDTVYAGDGEEVVMYYDKYAEADKRSDADITVHHKYTTYLTTVVDGEVKTLTIVSEPVVESYTKLKAGDEFEAVEKPRYNEKDYTKTTDEKDLIVTLQPGTNATIVIDYERSETQLTEATYTVNYVYNVYQMVVDENGETAYVLDTVNSQTESFAPAEGEVFYVGQDVVVDTRSREGFTPSNVPETVVKRLTSGSNNWTFVYEKRNDLPQNTVTVNHYYTTTTIAINGESTDNTQWIQVGPVTKYVGQTVTAKAEPKDFTLVRSELVYGEVAAAEEVLQSSYNVVVAETPAVVNFYYEKIDNYSVPVTYSIAHEYYLYDWNDSLISESKPKPTIGTGFATKELEVAPEATDYELISATYNGVALEDYTITLKEGENKIVFVYKKKLARDYRDVTVIHNYYKNAAAMQSEVPETQAQVELIIENQPEGSKYTAELRNLEGYVFHSATPDSKTIQVTDSGDNVIIMNYVATADYQVIHIYKRNNVEEGRVTETLNGLDGEIITADSIERVTEYNGKAYTFKSISGDITLDANEMQTITLVYNRTTGGGGGGSVTPKPPVIEPPVIEPPVIEIPEEDVPLVDIPEVEIPVTDLPEEDIPLADVPKTGDATALWMAMNALSGAALAGVSLLGRKKREDEEI